ncbi:MAG: LysM peptidoglycan-binding domain-containing protein [Geobacter sp.]|nr:LysM peptidoglycan-binding domain-containing protein [Geobacter sp.]
MKRVVFSLLAVLLCTPALPFAAGAEEPLTTYVIQKGDTLWGISGRFIHDPHYWPDLWANNPQVTNPHLIFPGQKVKVYRDRIEIEPVEVKKEAAPPAPQEAPAAGTADAAKDTVFTVSGGEGYLIEDKLRPAGMIISTHLNRQILGEDDIVYTDLGRTTGGKVGDRYSIFKKGSPISHPMTNQIVGYKVTPLGTLQIVELEDKVSKAIITKSYEEIGPGAYLMPYAEPLRAIALKSADRDLTGYIVETKSGNKAIASGDIAYLDLGKNQGLQVGNMVYVIRDVYPDPKFIDVPVGKLPSEVIGAMVVVDIGPSTSTALVVKSIDTIYRGDRVELIKSR